MAFSLPKSGTAPTCWAYRSDQSVWVVQCNHSQLPGLCTDVSACWGCAGSTALATYLLPRRSHLCRKSCFCSHSPFPKYSLDLLHKYRTCSVLETPWQCWFAVLKACSMCIPSSSWGLETEVFKSDQDPFWLLWWLLNLWLACSSLCLKLTPASFEFSNKFSSLGLLLAIQVPKWWQCGYLLPSDLQEGSTYLKP